MTTPMAVAYAVVTFYLLMAVLVATAFAVLIVVMRKVNDEESQKVIEFVERAASSTGFTVWGFAVLVGLRWPLLIRWRKR